MSKITCEECVRALKAVRRSWPAHTLASYMRTDSRSVATALRKATKDGRVTIRYVKGLGFYRFVRLTSRATP